MDLPEKFRGTFELVSTNKLQSGIVNYEVKLLTALTPRERGSLLLDLEDELCKLDANIRVWHTPLGDKNSLRNLRGVQL